MQKNYKGKEFNDIETFSLLSLNVDTKKHDIKTVDSFDDLLSIVPVEYHPFAEKVYKTAKSKAK